MNVVKLAEYSCRDTISILKVLLTAALGGRLRGLIVSYRKEDGNEETVYTGIYKANPSKAAGAALRASLRMMRANGELE